MNKKSLSLLSSIFIVSVAFAVDKPVDVFDKGTKRKTARPIALQDNKAECSKRVAAFDVGSGTTKMKVADVDVCHNKVSKILMENQEKVDYAEDLAKGGASFNDAVLVKGVDALNKLKAQADTLKPKPEIYTGVATASFRKATNSKDFLADVEKKTGISITVISQEQEGTLGFLAATSKAGVNMNQAIVWDIGAGSMQMSMKQGDSLTVYQGNTGSVIFKNQIIEKIQGKSGNTPNPMSKKDAEEAVKLSKKAASDPNSRTLTAIQAGLTAQGATVLGIGGVHVFSVQGQTAKDGSSYTLEQLAAALDKKIGLTDEQIGTKYANTDVSNLALVLGYMKALNIEKVTTVKVDLSDGVLWSLATQK